MHQSTNSESGVGDSAHVEPYPETILVVEDEDFVRGVTREVLQFAGYRVLEARTAAEAIHAFRENSGQVRLLLTDVVLPGRNGHELARDLTELRSDLKTIFISGYPQNQVTQEGALGLAALYLPKPFSVDSLMHTIRQVLPEPKSAPSPKDRLAKSAAGSG